MLATVVLLSVFGLIIYTNVIALKRFELPKFVFPVVTVVAAIVGWLTSFPGSPYFVPGDFLLYLREGAEIRSNWGIVVEKVNGGDTRILIKIAIALMNYLPFAPEIGIGALSALTYGTLSTVVQLTTRIIFQIRSGLIVTVFLLLTPSIMYQGSAYREPYFLLATSFVMLAASLVRQENPRFLLVPALAAIGSLSACAVRPELGATLIIPGSLLVITQFLWFSRNITYLRTVRTIFGSIMSVSLVSLCLAILLPSQRASLSQTREAREELAEIAETGYANLSESSSLNYFDFLLRTVLGPFPLEIASYSEDVNVSVALSGHLIRWMIALLSLIYALIKFRNHYTIFSATMLFGSIIIFSLVLGNYGALMRFRDVLVVIFLPLSAEVGNQLMMRVRRARNVNLQ